MNILAIVEPSWYGVKRALQTYTTNCVSPADAKDAIAAYHPRIVIFGCYKPEWEPILHFARRQGCRTVLTWFASYVLNDFDHINGVWLHAALTAAKGGLFDHIAVPHLGLERTWTALMPDVDITYMPLTVSVETLPVESEDKRPGIHIGIFGSAMPWKNMECQIIAASLVPGATIHVHQLPPYPNAADTHNISVVRHAHIADDYAYFQLLGQMHVNMCVSLSETYSYLCAESLLMGTPVLTGMVTPILQDATGPLTLSRTSAYDDPYALSQSLQTILTRSADLIPAGRIHMLAFNSRMKHAAQALRRHWQSFL